MLSRLPLPSTKDAVSVNAINMFQIDLLPISTEQMRKATLGDSVGPSTEIFILRYLAK